MSYTDVFGGQTIFPAQLTLLKLTLTANLTLAWPVEQALPGDSVFADIIQVTPNAGLALTMPDARQATQGQSTLINNVGANTLSIKDNAGNVIGSVASGEVWQFYLDSNTTQAGVWRTFQFGTGASSAVAAALAGAGLKAITTTLNVKVAPTVTNVTPINVVDADRAKAFVWNGGVGALNLPDPATVGADWFVYIRNAGTGNLTVTPAAGLIDGAASKTFQATESALVITDGTDYYLIGFSATTSGVFDHVSINVGGAAGDYTLSGGELNRITYEFTGVLTGNRNVVVPTSAQQYWVANNTTGAFTLTVKTNAGTGVAIPQGYAAIVYCDGINVVAANGDPLTAIAPIALGGTGAATAAAARTNLGVAISAATVCKSADQSVADNVETTMAWASETTDQGGWHDNAVNNSRLTVPSGITFARFWGQLDVLFDNAGNPYTGVLLKIKKNGATTIRQMDFTISLTSTGGVEFCYSIDTGWLSVTAGDYFEMTFIADGSAGIGSTVRAGAGIQSYFACEGRAS
jgi:hypothetical protein